MLVHLITIKNEVLIHVTIQKRPPRSYLFCTLSIHQGCNNEGKVSSWFQKNKQDPNEERHFPRAGAAGESWSGPADWMTMWKPQ